MKNALLPAFLLIANAWAITEPPLPAWDEDLQARMTEEGWVAGSSLLSYDPPGEESDEDSETSPLTVGKPEADEISPTEESGNFVKEEHLGEYFANRPEKFIIDPQRLLGSKQTRDLESFLQYHSGDSSIDMFIYVFGGDQEIPSDVREEEVVERLYSVGKPALVIYYFLGAPQRSELYLSPVLTDAVSAAEQRRALESSVIQAFVKTDSFEQLQAFLVQMSIRVYWMERMADGTAEETSEAIPADSTARAFHRKKDKVSVPTTLPDWAGMAIGGAVSALGGTLFLYVAMMWWRARARFSFPEFEVETRLGGNHAAGIGAVISFASAALPPASQRDQVPDYMRRA